MSEITELADFFFAKELKYDKKMLIWKGAGEQKTREALEQVQKILLEVKEKDWNKEKLQEILMPEAEKVVDRGLLLWPLRVALTGKEASAGPFEVAQALGKTKTLQRIEEARTLIQ